MNLDQAFIAAHRFGFGASKKLIKQIEEPKVWLLNQVSPENITAELGMLDLDWTSQQAIQAMALYRKQKKLEKKPSESSENMMMTGSDATKKAVNKQSMKLVNRTISHAINSESPFYWRLVDFFSNHFSVSVNGQNMRALAPLLETEAIAPNISGYFSEMLLAVESHPAMLVYLNNEQSIGPNSKAGLRSKGKKGLNENLAREIMELHTLGVGAGYDQADVTELARAITGWGVDGAAKLNSGFQFRAGLHEPGSRNVFGKVYRKGGVDQGIKILKDLAENPKTAEHVSRKLVTHFINDNAPQVIVDEMVTVWMQTKGNIPKVISAMLESPLSWSDYLAKFKTPREFLISTCRACDLKRLKPDFVKSLAILGQQPFSAGSPAGYKDTQEYWAGPRAMMGRIEWAEHVSKFVKKVPMDLAQQALGSLLDERTAKAMSRAESKQQAVTLFLMSPEFQKR
ncbi:DUF1800 domain-containing protein [Paraglaciecola aquimarina]|uniref:DUF1800 domain-containing protein n=1 Tax=Paraglaciecola algarum TaxID=3050085 RepID=A0ABS9D4H2_9ALTE|nr:DUF1800 domain-containing protein [Paraglaciecola sp. G1-23]MCF2946601.1 DUF1800 domain-containing protein [Paraglaciecola sp. G1-23]